MPIILIVNCKKVGKDLPKNLYLFIKSFTNSTFIDYIIRCFIYEIKHDV